MSQEVSKWLVNGLFHLLINGIYRGFNPFTNHLPALPTGHPSTPRGELHRSLPRSPASPRRELRRRHILPSQNGDAGRPRSMDRKETWRFPNPESPFPGRVFPHLSGEGC